MCVFRGRCSIWEMAVNLAVACDVFDGDIFCAVLFPGGVWIRFGIELSQFLRIFLPTSVDYRVC